jgi:hypothetical protein
VSVGASVAEGSQGSAPAPSVGNSAGERGGESGGKASPGVRCNGIGRAKVVAQLASTLCLQNLEVLWDGDWCAC